MKKIIRTPTEAKGGITPEELALMKKHSDEWIKIAFRTDPIDKDKITEAIKGLYRVSGLKEPRVVIVPSPKVMAFAGSLAAAWWSLQGNKKTKALSTNSATYSATDSATNSATRSATRSATYLATDSATDSATDLATYSATYSVTRLATDLATRSVTRSATYSATDSATRSATNSATNSATYSATNSATNSATDLATYSATNSVTDLATADGNIIKTLAAEFLGKSAKIVFNYLNNWSSAYQGGNMWAPYNCYLTAFRDILKLSLDVHDKYKYWEMAAKEGGFRYMHEEFCMVCDFPKYIHINKANQPHCDGGASHEWLDGWKLWHLNDIKVEQWMAETLPEKLDAKSILKIENVDQRREVLRRLGVANLVNQLGGKVVDKDHKTKSKYELLELEIGLDTPCRYLKMNNPSIDAIHVEGVPNDCMTVQDALNWRRYGNKALEWNPSQLT